MTARSLSYDWPNIRHNNQLHRNERRLHLRGQQGRNNAPYEVRFPDPIEVTAETWELDYVYDEVTENDLAE